MASKKLGINPKDSIGSTKVPVTSVPFIAQLYESAAFFDGRQKYGPFNWRKNKVIASIYVDAAIRHLLAWFEREENAPDSGVHHLGHVKANMSILLDAQATGNLVDDRPQGGSASFAILNQLNQQLKEKYEQRRKQEQRERRTAKRKASNTRSS